MTPLHHAWDDDPIDVRENLLKRLALFGCSVRELFANGARFVGAIKTSKA